MHHQNIMTSNVINFIALHKETNTPIILHIPTGINLIITGGVQE